MLPVALTNVVLLALTNKLLSMTVYSLCEEMSNLHVYTVDSTYKVSMADRANLWMSLIIQHTSKIKWRLLIVCFLLLSGNASRKRSVDARSVGNECGWRLACCQPKPRGALPTAEASLPPPHHTPPRSPSARTPTPAPDHSAIFRLGSPLQTDAEGVRDRTPTVETERARPTSTVASPVQQVDGCG